MRLIAARLGDYHDRTHRMHDHRRSRVIAVSWHHHATRRGETRDRNHKCYQAFHHRALLIVAPVRNNAEGAAWGDSAPSPR